MPVVGKAGAAVVERAVSRLRFPQLFAVLVALFLLDLFIPDLLPFADEILLGLLAALFGSLKTPRPTAAAKPPEKNVTPPQR